MLKALAAEGWKEEPILLLPSHSHTSLDLSALNPNNDLGNVRIGLFHPELFAHTVERLAQVIKEAGRNPVPVRFGTSSRALQGLEPKPALWGRNDRQ